MTTFTDQEFDVIFAVCSGLPHKKIAEQLALDENVAWEVMRRIFDKIGASSRLELIEFVRGTLNGGLQRRKS